MKKSAAASFSFPSEIFPPRGERAGLSSFFNARVAEDARKLAKGEDRLIWTDADAAKDALSGVCTCSMAVMLFRHEASVGTGPQVDLKSFRGWLADGPEFAEGGKVFRLVWTPKTAKRDWRDIMLRRVQ
jgi:hypothetical protein